MKFSETGLVLTLEDRIPGYFVSLNGQVKFYTLASMLLESAGLHASMHGFGYHDMIREDVYWVLSRFQVSMMKYPLMNDPLVLETWPKGSERLFFLRDYRVRSPKGEILALATTAWLILDGKTGRPKNANGFRQLHEFIVKDRHAIGTVPGKLPAVCDPETVLPVTARYSDLDINKHVNALKYIEWIQDCYDQDAYLSGNIREFQINYLLETRFGEEVEVRMQKDPGTEGYDRIEGIRISDGNAAFRARLRFDKL